MIDLSKRKLPKELSAHSVGLLCALMVAYREEACQPLRRELHQLRWRVQLLERELEPQKAPEGRKPRRRRKQGGPLRELGVVRLFEVVRGKPPKC